MSGWVGWQKDIAIAFYKEKQRVLSIEHTLLKNNNTNKVAEKFAKNHSLTLKPIRTSGKKIYTKPNQRYRDWIITEHQ